MNLDEPLHTQLRETDRQCFRAAIPEIQDAANLLDSAVTAHLGGRRSEAEDLIKRANIETIRDWTESIWGKKSIYVQYRNTPGNSALPKSKRMKIRMPNAAEMRALHLRDGYHCRFCGIPVIKKAIRVHLRKFYPDALPWGRTNVTQHSAFQAMWAQYDHISPHSNGGANDLDNLVITCAPCNFGRMSYTLEEVGLADPRTREPIRSTWDGLERLLKSRL